LRWPDAGDPSALLHWNSIYLAARETAELRAETLQLGGSLLKLVRALPGAPVVPSIPSPTLPLAWAVAACHFGANLDEALLAWAFAWVENQLAVLGKAVPLGQQALQGLLHALAAPDGPIEQAVAAACICDDDAMVSALPGLAWLSATHETQYTRLFRS
jgi:urease accessory protein